MSSSKKSVVLVLGGAGAQNVAVARILSASGLYTIHLLTRSIKEKEELNTVPNVELIEGDCFDENTLLRVFKDVNLVFVNTNGFAIGEKNEIYWGIRIYEIARRARVEHFVYSGLPYVSRNGDFDLKRRVPFVDGKAKVSQYLSSMPTEPMAWSVVETGPYAERLWEQAPTKDADGTYVFNYPLGTGAMPLVSLESIGETVLWFFENRERSNGLNLGIAIAHYTGAEIAAAFTAATGKKARYTAASLEASLAKMPPGKIGAKASPGYDDPTNLTAAQHFGPWWGIFRDSDNTGKTGLWTKDYALLDKIFPNRIKTLEEWMRRVNYNGERKAIYKTGLSLG